MSKGTTIFTAEATAITKALEYIEKNETSRAVILSDSLSVLTSIRNLQNINSRFINPLVSKIKTIFNRLINRQYEVKFVWVKAHVGLLGNEEVDRLAKESTSSGEVMENMLPLQDSISICKNRLLEVWRKRWKVYRLTNPTRYTLIQKDIPKEYWYNKCNYPRQTITTISRLKFGHGCYPMHLKKIGIIESNLCDTCSVIGDLDHIFFSCQKYTQESKELYDELIKLKVTTPFNILHILTLNQKSVIDTLMRFLHKAKINI